MFFVYLAALLLIAGGELNRVLELLRQKRSFSQPVGQPGSAENPANNRVQF